MAARWCPPLATKNFQENQSNFILLPLYNLNIVQSEYCPLTFQATKRLIHVSHLKNNYIFGILEPRWMIWYIFKQDSSTFIFDLMITLWSHFQTLKFPNAQWCQSGISLFLCQEIVKKLQLYVTSRCTSVPTRLWPVWNATLRTLYSTRKMRRALST